MSARMVTPGSRVADVGCDHAHTSIFLLEQRIATSCIGMDVRQGPLGKAAENLEVYGLTDRIELRLSDGLTKLAPGEADSIVIAGMGGILTVKILSEGIATALAARELILQPQSHIDEVRRFLMEHGCSIADEDMCYEDGKYYVAMRAVPQTGAAYSEAELEFGPVLLAKRHPILHRYLESEQRKAVRRLSEIAKSDSADAKRTYFETREKLIGYSLALYE